MCFILGMLQQQILLIIIHFVLKMLFETDVSIPITSDKGFSAIYHSFSLTYDGVCSVFDGYFRFSSWTKDSTIKFSSILDP